MSKYSGKCDFRDTLEINFDNNFSEFMDRTGGIIYHYNGVRYEPVHINEPADLIPWYPYVVASGGFSSEHAKINLAEKSELDERIDTCQKAVAEETEDKWLTITNSALQSYLQTKQDLKKLYKEEKRKPKDEQRII